MTKKNSHLIQEWNREHVIEVNNHEIVIVGLSCIVALSIFLMLHNVLIAPVIPLNSIQRLRGGNIRTYVTQTIETKGTNNPAPYKTFDYRPKKRLVKPTKRFLNQEEILALLKTHFDSQNTDLVSQLLTKKGEETLQHWQFVRHSNEVERVVEKNLPIFITNRVDKNLSLSLLVKVYVFDRVRRWVFIRGGNKPSILITQPSGTGEKISQKKQEISLSINKKLFVFVTLGLVVLLIFVVYLFLIQRQKIQVTQKNLNNCNLNSAVNLIKKNREAAEFRAKAKKFGETVEGMEKKYEKLKTVMAEQAKNSKGLQATIGKQTQSLKRLQAKIKRICLENKIVDADCKEYQDMQKLQQIKEEFAAQRNQILEDRYGVPRIEDQF